MSHLYRVGLLNYNIIQNSVIILIRNAKESESELMIEYAVTLMKHVGPFIVQRKEDINKFNGYVTYLQKFKEAASDQIKFSIDELTEFRDRKWISI
uniref:Uncharacterized protein n=1 Tax=Panagrolaimus superbus TaxID=310955 RepID=A0A914Y4V3_9BILA